MEGDMPPPACIAGSKTIYNHLPQSHLINFKCKEYCSYDVYSHVSFCILYIILSICLKPVEVIIARSRCSCDCFD